MIEVVPFDEIERLRRSLSLPVDVTRRGPVLLDRFFEELAVRHVALPNLTRREVAGYLRQEGIDANDLGDESELLAGFVFVAGRVGWAFVNANDILPRRRFTAAHELGHFVLHREVMGRFRADTPDSISEADEDRVTDMEREANRFAVELLMPSEVCHARAEEMRNEHGTCPRGVLVYRLAAELLVSREAMRYRLADLEVGDE
jgi:IrrE N-terminal-like domain